MSMFIRALLAKVVKTFLVKCDMNNCLFTGKRNLRILEIDWCLCRKHYKIIKNKLEGL